MGGESDNNNNMAFGVAAQYAKSFLVSLIPTNKKPCCNRLDHSYSYHHHHHHARTSSSSLSSPSSSPSSLSSSSSFSSLGGVNMLDYNDSQLGVPNHPSSSSPSSYFSIRRLKSRLSSSSSMNSTTSTTTTPTSSSSSTRDALPTTPSHHYLKSAKKLKSKVWDAIKANSKGKQREVSTTTATTAAAALITPPHEVQTQLVVTALEVAQPPSPSPLSCVENDDHEKPYYYACQQVEFHNDYYSSLNEEDFKTAVDDFIERFNQHVAQEEHTYLYS